MPKAFTHLCEKVNLSLYDTTLTIYPKQQYGYAILNKLRGFMASMFPQMLDCITLQVVKCLYKEEKKLGIYRYVQDNDSNHDLYHQDDFNSEDNHSHVQFSKTIDENKLDEILKALEQHSLITSEEHQSCISAYHTANALPQAISGSKISVVKEQENSERSSKSATFPGLKKGFLLSASENEKNHDYLIRKNNIPENIRENEQVANKPMREENIKNWQHHLFYQVKNVTNSAANAVDRINTGPLTKHSCIIS